jgi:hypothetical protein
MCELYGVQDEKKIEMLLDILTSLQRRGWWEAYEEVLPSGLEVYVGLEADARAERAWEPLLIHGLLQTPEYARAILQATRTHRPTDVDDLIKLRAERQQKVLMREDSPLDLWVVLDEGAIRRPVGGVDVMQEQLQHLRAASDLPNVTVQIFPFAKGSHPGLGGAFSLLEFEADPPVTYVDSPAGNLYLEKERDVRRFVQSFDLLRASALDPDESTALIERAAEEMQ